MSPKELEAIRTALLRIESGELGGLDVKALQSKPGFIRVRVGRIRIICRRTKLGYEIIHLASRNEKTYRDL